MHESELCFDLNGLNFTNRPVFVLRLLRLMWSFREEFGARVDRFEVGRKLEVLQVEHPRFDQPRNFLSIRRFLIQKKAHRIPGHETEIG